VNTQLLANVTPLMHVGKNNFRPPPKVDSRVVRIEPKNPPPPVNFVEWDGLLRLLFTRKNKTLRAVLVTKNVLAMLESNMRTLKALKNEPIPEEGLNVKALIDQVLEETGCSQKRAAKMRLDEFLELLVAFNDAGIHFA
jgi:18S rRNA (adenine1779-N6/adenine1780-N6)-dimethyltransferase